MIQKTVQKIVKKKIVQGSKGPVHILSNDCNVINDNEITVLLDFMLIFIITIIIITIIIIIFISTREMWVQIHFLWKALKKSIVNHSTFRGSSKSYRSVCFFQLLAQTGGISWITLFLHIESGNYSLNRFRCCLTYSKCVPTNSIALHYKN